MKIIKAYWKTILWACIVLILSTMPKSEMNELPRFDIPHLDKIIHFTMYFVFTFLMLWDTKHYCSKTKFVLRIFVFAILFGGLMEILQTLPFIHRTCDIFDFLANTTGVIFAGLLFRLLESFWWKAIPLTTTNTSHTISKTSDK